MAENLRGRLRTGEEKDLEFRPVKLGRYVLYERLASGGMAEVYRATSGGAGGFQKQLAIKRILPNYANNEEFRRMFETEARICSSLTHANIVQVYDFQKNGEVLLLAMEFVNGKNLRQFINKLKKLNGNIPIEFGVFIVNEVCKGLEYAHSKKDDMSGKPQNIIHRDMSPQNVMLSYDGAVKIVDFGIAKAKDRVDETRAGVIKGKFGYMSPEQANGETQNVDHRTDIFSTGIILWELLTGRRLFSAENDLATLKLIQECDITKPSKINPKIPLELEKLVMKALTKDLSLRYQSAGNFHRQLQEFLYKHFPSFSQKDAGEILQRTFEPEIESEKKRAEQFHNQSIPFSQGSQPAKTNEINDIEDALEEGSITKSEQGAQTAVTSEQDAFREPDVESLVSPGSDRTVNADLASTRASNESEAQEDAISQKTMISSNEDPFDRMPSLAEAREAILPRRENTSSKVRKIASSEENLATVAGSLTAPKEERTSAATEASIKLEERLGREGQRRKESSLSVLSDYSRRNSEPIPSRGINRGTNNEEESGTQADRGVELEDVPEPRRRGAPRSTDEDEVEEDLFKPKKTQSRFLTIAILMALGVTGYLYKSLLSGDVSRMFFGKQETRNTAGVGNNSGVTKGSEQNPRINTGTDPVAEGEKGGCQVRIDTDPPVPGGTYVIDEQTQHEFTAGSMNVDLVCGKLSVVRIEVPGYKSATLKIKTTQKSGERKQLSLQAERIGTVILTIDNPAQVFIDGIASGQMEASSPREFNLTIMDKPHIFRFTNGLLGMDHEEKITAVENVKTPFYIRLTEDKPKAKPRY